MALCSRCGQPLSFFQALRGFAMHPGCKRQAESEEMQRRREAEAERLHQEKEKEQQRQEFLSRALAQIERGEFKDIPVPSEIILQPEEKCYGQVQGCWFALLYPSIMGRSARPAGSTEIRKDGVVRKERGNLFITQQRVLFISPVTSRDFSLKRVLQCSVAGDVLHIATSGRSSGIRVIIPDSQSIQITAALIRKLAALSKVRLKNGEMSPRKSTRHKIVCYIWRCRLDLKTCSICREKQGIEWDRKKEIDITPPLSTCENPEGCRCKITPIYNDDVYDPEAGLES